MSASRDEAVERVAVVGDARIERRAPFRGVQHGEQRRLVAERVAVGSFHLDHVGAGVGEQLRAVGAGDPRREVDDAHVGERVRRRHGSLGNPSSRSPTMLRWIWCEPP